MSRKKSDDILYGGLTLESDLVTETEAVERLLQPTTHKNVRRRRPKDEGFSPPVLLVCRKCGKRSQSVELAIVAPDQSTAQSVVFRLAAQCPKCHQRVDECKVHATFSGISNWKVYSAHVG